MEFQESWKLIEKHSFSCSVLVIQILRNASLKSNRSIYLRVVCPTNVFLNDFHYVSFMGPALNSYSVVRLEQFFDWTKN